MLSCSTHNQCVGHRVRFQMQLNTSFLIKVKEIFIEMLLQGNIKSTFSVVGWTYSSSCWMWTDRWHRYNAEIQTHTHMQTQSTHLMLCISYAPAYMSISYKWTGVTFNGFLKYPLSYFHSSSLGPFSLHLPSHRQHHSAQACCLNERSGPPWGEIGGDHITPKNVEGLQKVHETSGWGREGGRERGK